MNWTLLRMMACLAALATGAGCGDDASSGDGDADAGPHDHEPSAETVGSAGGDVGSDSAGVSIPKGALPDDVEIGVEAVEVDSAKAPEGTKLVGDPIAFTPHGTKFDEPVTLRLPFDGTPKKAVVLRLDDADDTSWEVVEGGSFEDGVASLDVDGFSIYVVGDSAADGTAADVEMDVDCMQFCEDRFALGCTSEASVADCTTECIDNAIDTADPCYEAYVAMGICAATHVAEEFECVDGQAELTGVGGNCTAEMTALMSCLGMGG